ncbi:MAG: hypothetical protein AB9844_12155 [Clostridiaceae bacterium]
MFEGFIAVLVVAPTVLFVFSMCKASSKSRDFEELVSPDFYDLHTAPKYTGEVHDIIAK